jgi:hypothetical protein
VSYLSIALVLIFVLYLIDKHNAWKSAAKTAAAVAAMGLFSAGGIYGWHKYDEWKAWKKREAEVKACTGSLTEGAIVFVPSGDEVTNVVKTFCESNPGKSIACGLKADESGDLVPYSLGDKDKGNPAKVCTAIVERRYRGRS